MAVMKTTLSPSAVASSGTTDTTIVRAAIYPGIGVARIGNSTEPDGFVGFSSATVDGHFGSLYTTMVASIGCAFATQMFG